MALKRPEGGERKRISRASLTRSMRLFRYIAPYKLAFTLGLFCLVISSGSMLAIFYQLGDLIDFTKGKLHEKVLNLSLLMGVILLISSIASYVRIYTFAIVTEKTIARVRQDVYSRLVVLPMKYLSKQRVGEFSSQISTDISTIQNTLTTYLAEFLRQFIIIIGSVIIMLLASWKLALFMSLTLPVMAVFAVSLGRQVRKLSKKAQKQVAESNTIVEETLQAIQSVKTFTGELFEISRYRTVTDDLVKTGLKNAVYRGAMAAAIITVILSSVIGIVWFGSYLVGNGEISVGVLFRFFLLSVFMAGSVGGLADTYAQLQKTIGATEKVLDIIDEDPEYVLSEKLDERKRFIEGDIEFQDLNFTYPDREGLQILKNVSFHINSGEQVAIVGPSGAGKSTIMSLLLRFYEPNSGKILVDGKDYLSYNLGDYRSQLAIVPQDILLFGGSIKENIRYGTFSASDEEIIEAAKRANAHEFIMQFPDGYDTIVGERGTKLSGGQRQRVAIARAVLNDPAILLLDEATSSLDSESEKLVQDALDKLMKGRTSIVIAHRLSTIKNADKIIVLDKGEIREIGTHEQLLSNTTGIYHHLSELQFGV